ncbi:MAG: S41 family peptidase [Gemmatimonadota bacterium]
MAILDDPGSGMRIPVVSVLTCVFLACWPGLAAAQARVDDPVVVARLDGLSRLWGQVEYFHPSLAYRTDVDWDAALASAVPAVLRADSDEEYAAALQRMLTVLDDPFTRIEAPDASSDLIDASAAQWTTEDGILVVRVGSYYDLAGADTRAVLDAAGEALSSARAVILDLRSPGPTDPWARSQLEAWVGPFERRLTGAPLQPAAERRRVYYGFPSFGPFSSGQYRSGLLTIARAGVSPAGGAKTLPSVVLLNRYSAPLPATVPSQAAGAALIVFDGDPSLLPGSGETIELPGGITVRVRTSEAMFVDGTDASLRPDTVVREGRTVDEDPALDAALARARAFEPSGHRRRPLAAAGVPRPPRSYPEMTLPDVGYRFVALARLWNTIEHFYPYKHLVDVPWDDVQPEFISRFLAAETAAEYGRAVVEMSTRIQDSHTYVAGRVISDQILPDGFPPIRVRWIEGQPVVTQFRHPQSAGGVNVGDVVVSVDGEDALVRLERYARLMAASTPDGRHDKASLQFLNGPVGSDAELVLRAADGRVNTVTLERVAEDYTTLYHRERSGDVVRILDGDVGYVDLDRLEPSDVDAMFERLAGTRAIVFDMRGYPKGTVWWIAPRLADAARTVALFTNPMPGHASPGPSGETFRQVVAPGSDGKPRYAGRTLMLIDERSQSQAEHTGLYLRAANGTEFIGSPTAGANGEITSVTLPGAITVGFTGQSVRHPDGRELQRVGLVPDVEVRPTLAGIRSGRDEVLERALAHVREGGD